MQSVLESSELKNQWVHKHNTKSPKIRGVQKVMSQRSAGLCTCCTHANAFHIFWGVGSRIREKLMTSFMDEPCNDLPHFKGEGSKIEDKLMTKSNGMG